MSEVFDEKLTEFAGILEAFAANQRQQALAESKRQRVTMIRTIQGVAQVSFEAVVDETTTSAEIFEVMGRIDRATDRLEAKANISNYLNKIAGYCGEIEVASHKMAELRLNYQVENEQHNASRYVRIEGLTDAQKAGLKNQEKSIKALFANIDEAKKAIAEAKLVLAGDDALGVVERQINDRVERIRTLRLSEVA